MTILRISKQIFDRIDRINWFMNCGVPLVMENKGQSIVRVHSWEQAKNWYLDSSWECTVLEARNALTEFLNNKYPDKYLEWNNIVKNAKVYIESSLSTKLQNYREQFNLDSYFIDCVKWDVLHAIIELVYIDCERLPKFFLELLIVYENGNFPCGWVGNYPNNGNLVVF